ncbi:PREDICTED: uncharacterized protein LOC105456644 isoform X2 [Wasmannia auropunctata]|uniref:uncharacterized protein LOC105456644 isoform X2 n=1 Tax=Wasmannia auropunctata TaxID=64793 RepID=UPI0005ED744C|nr:PREDICTED: uncharacterized protein LOC105456644 isoform X2 [Wasmannia auropunctata]
MEKNEQNGWDSSRRLLSSLFRIQQYATKIFNGRAMFGRIPNTNSVRPQLDSNTTFNTQQSLEKSQNLQSGINSQQNDITSHRVRRPSLFLTPPKISYSACGQTSSKSYPTPRSSSQQQSSMCGRESFKGSTYSNFRLNQRQYSSSLSSLNIPETSSTSFPSEPRLFSTTSARPLRSASRTGKQLGGFTGGNEGISGISGVAFAAYSPPRIPVPNAIEMTTSLIGIDADGLVDIRIYENKLAGGDLNHPPHIHSLDVECSKTMMTINIEFNRAFDGIIYSKGYYTNPECIYVKQNSGSTRYSFTVNLDSCGTQFINDFEGATGQAYLENVLVLQNEPGIQEVWDAVRRVRCLWEGNINKALTVNLSIDMLNQEIVTFSGDTATAKLDIQIGKGPLAPAADGLVKIGETMTLVVSVEGDPGFDLQVRDCLARDEASINILQLIDERGCIVKPKLFGAFQKTLVDTGTGASVIAYAFFQAFKFPDVMDLFIECNVELCKTNCVPCPEANQQIEPRKRRRSITYASSSSNSANSVLLSDPIRVRRRLRVIMLDDLSIASSQILDSMKETTAKATKEICISNNGFYTIFSLTLGTLLSAIISAVVLYVKLQRIC